MRRLIVLALLALALPIAAMADGIDITNTGGSITASDAGISTIGSSLTQWNGIVAAQGHSLGKVSFTTGALTSGSIAAGGTFSATGSSFLVVGIGKWAKQLTGQSKNPVTLFSGSFVGPIDWTLVSKSGVKLTYTLSGTISGMLYDGRVVTGTTTQTIYSTNGQISEGIGHIRVGNTQFPVPEPGTFGLIGTGLLGMAGMFRRKLMGV
jgi:hypothetical protein